MFASAKGDTGYNTWRVGEGEQGWSVQTSNYSIMVSGEANEDPSINYAIAVIDFGLPSSFGFFFTTPIVPTGTPNTVRASLSGSLNDAAGNGVSITPTLPDADGDSLLELQTSDLTAPVTNMGVDVGTVVSFPAAPPTTYPFGPFNAGPQAGPGPGPWTGLQASLGFTLSGDSDLAVVTGLAEILPVPEPSGLALAALMAVGALAYRRAA